MGLFPPRNSGMVVQEKCETQWQINCVVWTLTSEDPLPFTLMLVTVNTHSGPAVGVKNKEMTCQPKILLLTPPLPISTVSHSSTFSTHTHTHTHCQIPTHLSLASWSTHPPSSWSLQRWLSCSPSAPWCSPAASTACGLSRSPHRFRLSGWSCGWHTGQGCQYSPSKDVERIIYLADHFPQNLYLLNLRLYTTKSPPTFFYCKPRISPLHNIIISLAHM